MAYGAFDYRAVVRGTFDNGEIWTNTWAFLNAAGAGSVGDLVAAIHDLYEAIFLLDISSHTHAVGCTVKELDDGDLTEGTWASITGDDLADLLPTSCAVRVSLSADGGVRGGPFISGWSINAVDADGNLLAGNQTGLRDAVDNFNSALALVDWVLAIDRPTVETVVDATQVRVGERFDVIRKRTNDLAEAYVSAGL